MSQQENIDAIQSQELQAVSIIPIELFNKRTNKVTQLVNNSSLDLAQKGQNKWYEFSFKEEIYITTIRVNLTGYGSYKDAEVNCVGALSKDANTQTIRIKDDYFEITINDLVSSFSFRPEKRRFHETTIMSVNVTGYTKQDFNQVLDDISDIEKYRNRIIVSSNRKIEEAKECQQVLDDFETEKEEAQAQVDTLREEEQEITGAISSLKDTRDDIQAEITAKKSIESDTTSRIEALEDSIDQKKNEQRNLNNEISNKTSDLKSLKENINMFPSEITGFVDQGANSIKKYVWLASVPIGVLVLVTVALFFNAADLTVVYQEKEDISMWSILLTRLPYVIIAITLIHACYRIAKIFISEIMKINRQRLNLSKISIIATDVSSASAEGLGFNDDEIYQYRTQLKMELLREHLKEYISEDYTYKTNPSEPQTQTNEDQGDSEDVSEPSQSEES